MERLASYLNHNGTLVNINDLNWQRAGNKTSPMITATRQSSIANDTTIFIDTQEVPEVRNFE